MKEILNEFGNVCAYRCGEVIVLELSVITEKYQRNREVKFR